MDGQTDRRADGRADGQPEKYASARQCGVRSHQMKKVQH